MEAAAASCSAEFTIEPFTDGSPGPHVAAALEAIAAHGLSHEMGPFATRITGDPAAVTAAMQAAVAAALGAGASRISVTFSAQSQEFS